jgi:hypothetical protein
VPLQIQCSSCGHLGTVPDEYIGREIQCPQCRTVLVPLTQDKMESFAAKVLFSTPVRREETAEAVIESAPSGPEISFTCPFCSESYQVSKELEGKKIACRNCHEPSRVESAHAKKKTPPEKPASSWPLIAIGVGAAVFLMIIGFILGQVLRF